MRMSFNTLSGRFLGLTIVFVMIAEVLIFVPSVARFRETYLQTKLDMAQLAALTVLAAPQAMVSPDLEMELLETAEVRNVAFQRDDIRELALRGRDLKVPDASYDISDPSAWGLIRDALATYFQPPGRLIQVEGKSRQGTEGTIEILMEEDPLRMAMIDYGLRILYLSLAISIATASALFFAVRYFIVRPIKRVAENMTSYAAAPEDSSRIIAPGKGARELFRAETALHDLQVQLTGALRQKERLAALGGAVAKISHDLRNMLTTGQLLADRMEMSSDPAVKRIAPKLVNSLSRAIALCERTLAYGKAEEPPPDLAVMPLGPLADEVLENERAARADCAAELVSAVPEGLNVRADADQLYRVLSNLVRNAVQAIAATGGEGRVEIDAEEAAGSTRIFVRDTGPGLPPKAQDNLFQAFKGGTRREGSGLGLSIAAELVRGHGGTLSLDGTGPEGTSFLIELPAP